MAPLLNKVPGIRRPGQPASLPLRCSRLATSSRWLSAMALPVSSPRRPDQPAAQPQRPASSSATAPPVSNFFPMALRHGVASFFATAPGQQHLPDGSSLQRPCQQLRHGVPASNKPHPAEKSTPVWLAIWRTWAGFANSQLRRVTFRCTYSYICTHPRYCRLEQLLRQTQIFRPICTDCLRHLRISAR